MAHFAVITTSGIPDGTRGAITRWLIEPAPGVYVGTLTARVRTYLWNAVKASIDQQTGWAAIVYNAPTEQGYHLETHGQRHIERTLTDLDGLTLVAWTLNTTNNITEW